MDILKLAAENSPRSKMIYHEDTQALHIGTLDKHCYFVPFAKGQDPFEDRENSQRMELLNGNWGFRYYDSIIDLGDDFIHEKFENTIPVPSNWQFTAMTSRSIRTCAIQYHLTRLLCLTIYLWEFISVNMIISLTAWTGCLCSRAWTAVFICM